MRQIDQIAIILKRDGHISNFQSIHGRLSLRLGARIYDLRQKGWEISTKELDNKDTVYTLVALPKVEQLKLIK